MSLAVYDENGLQGEEYGRRIVCQRVSRVGYERIEARDISSRLQVSAFYSFIDESVLMTRDLLAQRM